MATRTVEVMQCPHDQTVLQMTERQGVEIDYCPTCRGVWLDRGELDKIVDRVGAGVAAEAPTAYPDARPRAAADSRRHDDDDRYRRRPRYDDRDEHYHDRDDDY